MRNIVFITFWGFIALFASQTLYANELSAFEITENDFVVGDKNAPITIIEYASMSCSHCASFHTNTLPDIKKEINRLMLLA